MPETVPRCKTMGIIIVFLQRMAFHTKHHILSNVVCTWDMSYVAKQCGFGRGRKLTLYPLLSPPDRYRNGRVLIKKAVVTCHRQSRSM